VSAKLKENNPCMLPTWRSQAVMENVFGTVSVDPPASLHPGKACSNKGEFRVLRQVDGCNGKYKERAKKLRYSKLGGLGISLYKTGATEPKATTIANSHGSWEVDGVEAQ